LLIPEPLGPRDLLNFPICCVKITWFCAKPFAKTEPKPDTSRQVLDFQQAVSVRKIALVKKFTMYLHSLMPARVMEKFCEYSDWAKPME
jgi:hypothetical protein